MLISFSCCNKSISFFGSVPNSGNILENLLDDDNEIMKITNEQDCLTFTDEIKAVFHLEQLLLEL